MTNDHEKYMHRCIELAKNGLGTTYPNPLVGSIIVHNTKIIGEGWHYQSGKPHAEVNAITSVTDQSLLAEATIYISLEPCSHFGKTPPCSDLIIQKGIKKVVIGCVDSFAKVSGAGIQKLMNAGCDIVVGVLENKCQQLNKRFFTFHNKKRPYIILKWAKTTNDFIAPQETKERKPVWITNKHSRQLVHKWRAEEQAILIGNQTVIKDNPKLNTRDWHGKNPIRIVIDPSGKTPVNSFVEKHTSDSNKNLLYEVFNPNEDTTLQICNILYRHNIQSVIIEGGSTTLQSFIDKNLWDEARIFTGSTTFENGIQAPIIKGKLISEKRIINDTLLIYQND